MIVWCCIPYRSLVTGSSCGVWPVLACWSMRARQHPETPADTPSLTPVAAPWCPMYWMCRILLYSQVPRLIPQNLYGFVGNEPFNLSYSTTHYSCLESITLDFKAESLWKLSDKLLLLKLAKIIVNSITFICVYLFAIFCSLKLLMFELNLKILKHVSPCYYSKCATHPLEPFDLSFCSKHCSTYMAKQLVLQISSAKIYF